MAHGRFYWNELMTRDAEAAKTFFARTLGWDYEPFPMSEGSYWVIKAGGEAAGGIMPLGEDPEMAPMAERWLGYVEVDDVDKRLAEVGQAGGRVLRQPFEVPEVGRIAIVADPSGAVLGWITPAAEAG